MNKISLTEAFNVQKKPTQFKDLKDYDIFPDKKLLENLRRI